MFEEVWFHASTPHGQKAKVYDSEGKMIGRVRSYELLSRTAVMFVMNENGKVKVEDGKVVTETKQLPDSYLVIGGVKY